MQNRNRIIDIENVLMVARWERGVKGMGEIGEGIEKYKLVVYRIVTGMSSTDMPDPWIIVWEWPEGVGGAG